MQIGIGRNSVAERKAGRGTPENFVALHPWFLDELLQQVDLGQLPAKDWLKIVNQVLKLTTNHRARKIANKYHINWPDILPLLAIAKSQNEKIRHFRDKQWNRGSKE